MTCHRAGHHSFPAIFAGVRIDRDRLEHGSAGWRHAALRAGGERTRVIASAAALSDLGKLGGRFSAENPPPTLAWILHHVLQEYARHVGHLDIARELIDGAVGE